MQTFYRDLYYQNFNPYSQLLKFKTVHRSSLGGIKTGLLIFVISCLFLLGGSSAIADILNTNHLFAVNGVKTQAVVEVCYEYYAQGSVKTQFTYRYQLTTPDGIDRELTKTEYRKTSRMCPDFPVGSSIEIQYLSNIITQVRVVDPRYNFSYSPPLVPVLLILIIGALGALWGMAEIIEWIKAHLKYRKLIRSGVLVDGEIIETKKLGENTSPFRLAIKYRFITPNFQMLSGQSEIESDTLTNWKLPAPGTPVKVLYADDHCYVML